jgi:hypothetical protein
MEKFWEVCQTAAEAVVSDTLQVTPEARAVIIRWPGGGMVWNRPKGVRIFAPKGQSPAYIPIYDLTRVLQVACYSLAAVFTLRGLLAGRQRKPVDSM